jgi:hypothetical protein
MRLARQAVRALVLILGLLVLGACSGGGSKAAAPTSQVPAGTSTGAATREVELVRSVKPAIANLIAALKKGEAASAREAYETYDNTWNGIEVYVNFRSRELYGQLETELQTAIGDGLKADKPDFARLVPLAESLNKKYDEAIALSEKGPPLHPLFDDLAALRIAREPLRTVNFALTDGNVAKAKSAFASFRKAYPDAERLINARSESAAKETGEALNAATSSFEKSNASAAELAPLAATLMTRYNFGVSLLNAAARNADPAKSTFTEKDKQSLAGLNDISNQLRASQAAWSAGDFSRAGELSNRMLSLNFPGVQPALAEKNADAALRGGLQTYAGTAVEGGDSSKVAASYKAAVEAVAVAQQVIAGQFWTDPALQTFLTGLPRA